MERSHLEREEIQLDNAIQAPPNKQAKHSNANLQETFLLSKQTSQTLQRKPARNTLALQTAKNQANAEERAKRMRRNEVREAYL